MSEKILNGVKKASNRALNIGKNTCVPMEGCISGVRPSAVTCCALPLMELTLDMVYMYSCVRFRQTEAALERKTLIILNAYRYLMHMHVSNMMKHHQQNTQYKVDCASTCTWHTILYEICRMFWFICKVYRPKFWGLLNREVNNMLTGWAFVHLVNYFAHPVN